jgi:hypothetical protein
MEGISFLREGCFRQLGRERMEKSWEGRSGGSGLGLGLGFGSGCSTGREAMMEENGFFRRRRWN